MVRQLPATQLFTGSSPVGVSDSPTAGSDYIFLSRSPTSEPKPRRSVLNRSPTDCRDYITRDATVSVITSLGNLKNASSAEFVGKLWFG